MPNTRKTDYDYYDSHDFGDEMLEAEKRGELHTAADLGCSNAFEAGRKILAMKAAKNKSETVSVQLPKPLVVAIKRQAKNISIPWTSYIREALEVRVRTGV